VSIIGAIQLQNELGGDVEIVTFFSYSNKKSPNYLFNEKGIIVIVAEDSVIWSRQKKI